jgi:hypothetical protein
MSHAEATCAIHPAATERRALAATFRGQLSSRGFGVALSARTTPILHYTDAGDLRSIEDFLGDRFAGHAGLHRRGRSTTHEGLRQHASAVSTFVIVDNQVHDGVLLHGLQHLRQFASTLSFRAKR